MTHLLVVADQNHSQKSYQSLLGGQVLAERDPVIMKVANTCLTLVTGGGPPDDKPDVSLGARADSPTQQRVPQRACSRHRQDLPGMGCQGRTVPD